MFSTSVSLSLRALAPLALRPFSLTVHIKCATTSAMPETSRFMCAIHAVSFLRVHPMSSAVSGDASGLFVATPVGWTSVGGIDSYMQ